jgi:hypothetical protein
MTNWTPNNIVFHFSENNSIVSIECSLSPWLVATLFIITLIGDVEVMSRLSYSPLTSKGEQKQSTYIPHYIKYKRCDKLPR